MANALTLKSPTLKSPLAANASVNEDDVIAAKTALMNLGLYEVPEWGITGVPDRALFDAIRTFQKGTQLKIDGVMKPGGETESTLKTAAELVRRHGRNGDTILAHISPAEAELLHRVTDGGSINPETGLPEFFLGSMLGGLASSFVGSFAGPAAGSLVGSALSSFAAPVIDKYVSKKVGGPLGEIAGNTLGGYLGSGSFADIGGGLGQSFGNAVGGYAKRKVSQKIGGPLGDNIGDMLGSNLSRAVGGVAANGLTNTFGLEAKPASQPVSSPISDGVKDLLNPDYSSARTPGINPRDSRQSTARPTAPTTPKLGSPTLGSPARTSPSKPQPQPQTPWLPPLLASEPRANTMEIKPDTPRPRTQTMDIKGKRPALNLPAETISSNARTANALVKTSNFSAIKPHIQDAWTNGGEQGRAEVMNLAQQMDERKAGTGQAFLHNTVGNNNKISDFDGLTPEQYKDPLKTDPQVQKETYQSDARTSSARKEVILGKRKSADFSLKPNPTANDGKPWYEWHAASQTREHDALIEKLSKENGVDPDLTRAIMYMETTHGYYDQLGEKVGINDTIRPMNVHVDYWKELGIDRDTLHDSEQNIVAGVKILKRLREQLPNASIPEIATLYNKLGAEQVSNYGARVGKIYKQRLWEK